MDDSLPASDVTYAILSVTYGPMIAFTDMDLAPKESRSLPLCLTVTLNGVRVDSTLIDYEASVNVCPSLTLKRIGIDETS